jgi:tetratricopeptide (TPR) repeat protein
MTQTLGDAEAHEVVRGHNRIVRSTMARHRGVEVRALGDGFLLAFDAASDAVACAVAIQSELADLESEGKGSRIPVRIGINTATPIREGDDLVGEAVIVAQRVMTKARPARILIAESAKDQAGPLPAVRYVDRGLYHLKGIERLVRLFEVVWAPEDAVRGQDEAVRIPRAAAVQPPWQTPFVGRDAEIKVLEEFLDQAETGFGRVVLLSGDTGNGKSRLVFEFLNLISRRPLAMAAGRFLRDLGAPFEPALEWLRQLRATLADSSVPPDLAIGLAPLTKLAPDFSGWLPEPEVPCLAREPQEERLRFLGALADLLFVWSQREPLVLVLDDLHWADEHTLDLLRVVGRRLAPGPRSGGGRILIVGTCPEVDLGPPDMLSPWLADLERDRILFRLQVAGLTEANVELLLRELRGASPGRELTSFVFERSQGNAYFVEEIFRDLVESSPLSPEDSHWVHDVLSQERRVPKGIETVLEQRLSRFSRSCLDLLGTASLMGTRFRFEVLRKSSEAKEDEIVSAIEEALAAGVIHEHETDEGVAYTFHHSLVAQLVSERLSAPRRQKLHLQIARSLEDFYGAAAADHSGELAHHLGRAGGLAPAEDVVRYSVLAGDVASALYAPAEADRFFELALQAMARIPEVAELDRADLYTKRVSSLGRMGRVEEARKLADRAIAVFEDLGEFEKAARACGAVGSILVLHARHNDALPYLKKAAATRPDVLDEFRGAVLAQYATALDLTGRSDQMRSVAEELLAAVRPGNPELRERALMIHRNWYANHTTDVERARVLNRRALRSAEQRGDTWDHMLLSESTGFFELSLLHIENALAALDFALTCALKTGALAKIIDVRALRALCFCHRGEWGRVEEEWGEASPYLDQVPGSLRLGQLLWARIRANLWLGRPPPTVPPPGRTYPGISQFETAMLAGAGLVASERGHAAAAELLESASKRHPRRGVGLNWLPGAQALAAGWVNVACAGEAAQWYPGLTPYRRTLNLGFTALELARIAALNRWWDSGGADFAAAVRLGRREGLRPHLAIALCERARMERERRGPLGRSAASRGLREAEDLFRALGMETYLERTERLFPAAGRV